MADIRNGTGLYARYRKLLLDTGFATARYWPYRFACYDNSIRIPGGERAGCISTSAITPAVLAIPSRPDRSLVTKAFTVHRVGRLTHCTTSS